MAPEQDQKASGRLGRRTYVIDRGFQLKYTLILVVSATVISSVFGVMMYLAHLDAQKALAAGTGADLAAPAEQTLIWLLAGMVVLMAAALSLFGILITHRVAGPVYVMSHYISVLARGRYPILRPLRKGDELRAFFERFQEAVEALRTREVDEADAIRDALMALEPLATDAKARSALEQLRAIHNRKRDATDVVNVGGPRSSAAV